MKILNYQGTEHLIDKIYDAVNSGGSADYIVEQGYAGNGSWIYEKWASGKAIAYTPVPYDIGSIATTSSYGNGYYSDRGPYTFPVGLFISAPSVLVQVHGTTGLLTANAHSVTASEYSIYVGNMRNETVANGMLNVCAKGFWKTFNPSVSRMNPKKGTFTCTIPRLANQNVTFNYTQVAENILVATAEITANTSSDSGRLYLYFEGSPSGLPFTPLKGFGGCECNDVCYSMATSQNKNLWIGGLTGTMASGRSMTMRFILIG